MLEHVSKARELSLHTRMLSMQLCAMYKSTKKSVLDKGVALAFVRSRTRNRTGTGHRKGVENPLIERRPCSLETPLSLVTQICVK